MSLALYEEFQEVLNELIKDPTRSLRVIAKQIKSYRQHVWRQKKKLEEDRVIWGYTAIIDETKLGNLTYVMLIKFMPLKREMADIIIQRVNRYKKSNVEGNIRILQSVYMNGDYDWMIMYTAPSHELARRYFNEICLDYEEWIVERPKIMDINYFLIKEGKINPEHSKIYDYIPE